MVDQTFVFLSRSSLALGLPPIPRRLLPLHSIVQGLVLSLLTLQSSHFIFSSPAFTPPRPPPTQGIDRTISFVFVLMCLEGLCGGSAYVNTFYHVGREGADLDEGAEDIKTKMEKEFRIGSVGAADSCGMYSVCITGRKALRFPRHLVCVTHIDATRDQIVRQSGRKRKNDLSGNLRWVVMQCMLYICAWKSTLLRIYSVDLKHFHTAPVRLDLVVRTEQYFRPELDSRSSHLLDPIRLKHLRRHGIVGVARPICLGSFRLGCRLTPTAL